MIQCVSLGMLSSDRMGVLGVIELRTHAQYLS